MRRRSLRRHLKNACIRLIALSSLALMAAVFMTGPDRQSGYGASQEQAKQGASASKPPTFWERTESDPVAAFTGVLAVFTLALVVVSAVQIYFLTLADKNSRAAAQAAIESNKITRELFVAEKRPWIKVDAGVPKLIVEPMYEDDGRITIQLSLVLSNIGDSPALMVTRGWLQLYIDGTGVSTSSLTK
jgi:hypothetical protein